MQYKAFKEDVDKEESSMFVHELEQIWECIYNQIKYILDPRSVFYSSLHSDQRHKLNRILELIPEDL